MSLQSVRAFFHSRDIEINSAIHITPALMAMLTEGQWVDVCGSAA